MKYKALLTGNNRMIINEFFTYMDFSFECISTSERYDDIVSHIKYVEPDVFVYCLYGEKPDDLKRFINVERKISEQRIPLVIIGDPDDCDQFSRMAPLLSPLVLRKPITSQNIAKAIVGMLDERREAIEAERAAKAAAEEEVLRNAQNIIDRVNEEELLPELQPQEEERRKHILVVDDDSSVLKLLKEYLVERYDVATAISGKVALKFLETKGTDLVLLDYEMPVENGPAVMGKIRENEKTKNLPVVFLTGVTEREKIMEVLSMKPQGYLVKPVDMEKVSSTIKGILG